MLHKTILTCHCEGGTTEAIPFSSQEIGIAPLSLVIKDIVLRNSSLKLNSTSGFL